MGTISNVLAVVIVCFVSAACDTEPPPEVRRSINYSDDYKHRQMVAAFHALSSDSYIGLHRHSHLSELEEERDRRAINLFETLSNTDVKYLSIGCDTASVCGEILQSALELAVTEKLSRDDITLLLPEYLAPPYEQLDKLGIKVLIYKIPSLKGG